MGYVSRHPTAWWCGQVRYYDEDIVITPERAMAMLLTCMRQIAQREQAPGVEVKDVVLSVRLSYLPHLRAFLEAVKSRCYPLPLGGCVLLAFVGHVYFVWLYKEGLPFPHNRCRRTLQTPSAARCLMLGAS